MKGPRPEKEERAGETGVSDREGKVGDWWSQEAEKRASGEAPRVDWSLSPSIQRVINRRSSGTEDRNLFSWVRSEFIVETLQVGLSIGCGTGLLERDVLEQGLCSRVEGIDIADGALEVARRMGEGLPITYRRHDLDSEPLPAQRYNVVFSAGTMHHVCNLEFCVGELYASLKEGGLLVLSEFTGPARFQWTSRQLEQVSAVYSFLPWRHRYNYQAEGTVPYPRRAEVCSMIKGDPSEAVRSDEMLEVIERYFERVGRRRIGGTLLNPLLAGILENFNEEDEADLSFLMLAAELEGLLIEADAIPSDFVVDVYRRRQVPIEASDKVGNRSRLIKDQENVIEELTDRVASLRDDNREAAGRLEDMRLRSGELGAGVSRLQEENARLKTGPVFTAVRFARRLAGRPQPARPQPPIPAVESGPAAPVPCRQCEECVPATGEARIIARYVDGFASGEESLLLRWLKAVAGLKGERAVAVGLEPATVELISRYGICKEVDIAEVHRRGGGEHLVVKMPARGEPPIKYDLAFLDLSAGAADTADALRAVEARVAEDGALVVISAGGKPLPGEGRRWSRLLECLPSGWRDGDAGGVFTDGVTPMEFDRMERSLLKGCMLEAQRGFGTAAGGTARSVFRGRTPSGMERAVACLLIYAEELLIESDLLTPAFRISVYRKGPARPKRAAGEQKRDILAVQQREVERLENIERLELERGNSLSKDLAAEVENFQRVRLDLERLTEEGELLSKRGLARYRELARTKAANRRRDG